MVGGGLFDNVTGVTNEKLTGEAVTSSIKFCFTKAFARLVASQLVNG